MGRAYGWFHLSCLAAVALSGGSPSFAWEPARSPSGGLKASPTLVRRRDPIRNPVHVLVLTPREEAKRPYGLRMLAGMCLQLQHLPDVKLYIARGTGQSGDLPVDVRPALRTVTVAELWERLTDGDQPGRVVVEWKTASGLPCSVQFCFAPEEEFRPNWTRLHQCGPFEIVFGPVTSEAADVVIRRMRSSDPEIPILSATATATALTFDKRLGKPREHQAFYRFIGPDSQRAARLARELVDVVHAGRIGIVYESGKYGDGLLQDFQRSLSTFARPPKLTPVRYASGIAASFAAAVKNGKIDCPICQSRERLPAQAAGKSTADAERLETVFKQFRALDVDAVGLFGTVQDKKAILPRLRKLLPGVLVFTTDADFALEDYHCAEGLLVASPLDPWQNGEFDTVLDEAYSLFAGKLEPDAYMLQARNAADFLFKVTERLMERPDLRAQTVFTAHHQNASVGTAANRVASGVRFSPNGDLVGTGRGAQLLVVKRQKFTSLDQADTRHLFRWLVRPHSWGVPGLHYAMFYLTLLFAFAVSIRRTPTHCPKGAHDPKPAEGGESSAALRRLPTMRYEQWFQWGSAPLWLPYHVIASIVFGIYLVLVKTEGSESLTFLPNEFSILPTVFLDCQLAAFVGWYIVVTLQALDKVRSRLVLWGLPGQAESMSEAASRVFTLTKSSLWFIVCSMLAINLTELMAGVPVSGKTAAFGYFVLSLLTSLVFAFGVWFVHETRHLSEVMAQGFPHSDNLSQMYRHFCIVVEPFGNVTFAAAAVFALIGISRSRFFDHWHWPPLVGIAYALIGLLLAWHLIAVHKHWSDRMRRAKEVVVDKHPHGAKLSDAQQKELEQVASVPDWVWTPRLSYRVVGALLAPLGVTLLQNNSLALELWRSIAKLLSFG